MNWARWGLSESGGGCRGGGQGRLSRRAGRPGAAGRGEQAHNRPEARSISVPVVCSSRVVLRDWAWRPARHHPPAWTQPNTRIREPPGGAGSSRSGRMEVSGSGEVGAPLPAALLPPSSPPAGTRCPFTACCSRSAACSFRRCSERCCCCCCPLARKSATSAGCRSGAAQRHAGSGRAARRRQGPSCRQGRSALQRAGLPRRCGPLAAPGWGQPDEESIMPQARGGLMRNAAQPPMSCVCVGGLCVWEARDRGVRLPARGPGELAPAAGATFRDQRGVHAVRMDFRAEGYLQAATRAAVCYMLVNAQHHQSAGLHCTVCNRRRGGSSAIPWCV